MNEVNICNYITNQVVHERIRSTSFDSLANEVLIEQLFRHLNDCQQHQTESDLFDEEAQQLLKTKKDAFIAEVNNAIKDGSSVPPKSKQLDLIPCLATALHVFTVGLNNLLSGHSENEIPTTIPLSTLQCACKYVDYIELQKHMLCQVSYILNLDLFGLHLKQFHIFGIFKVPCHIPHPYVLMCFP